MSRPSNLNIYIYLRKSRSDIEAEKKAAELGETYDTLQRHRKTLLTIAKNERHNILAIYEEVVSGESIAERPQIQNLLRDLETGSADGVLVMDLDRLGRGDMYDSGILDRAFRYSGALLITPNEVYDPQSDSWELVFGIKTLVAREEFKQITRRMQGGRVTSASEGKSISKVPPYGYVRDENLRLHPNPETAWVVKKMFDMMSAGHGRITVANELDRLGIKPPDPKRDNWAPSSITAIIKNEVYLGTIIWGQVKHVKRNGKYKKTKLPREKWTVKENAHEPLVSRELFDAANKAHTGRHRPSHNVSKGLSNPLAGILKCEFCGYTMLYQPRNDRPNDTIRCVQPSCKTLQKGSALAIVEERVLQYLELFANDLEVQAEDGPVSTDDTPYKKMLIGKKNDELAELESQKSRLHDFLERGVYDIDTFMERQQNLTARINGIQDEIRVLTSEIQKDEIRDTNVNEFLPQLRKVIDAYKNTNSIEKKNALLKEVLDKVTYLRKKEWTKRDEFELVLYPKLLPLD